MALTFDDGPDPTWTGHVLAELRRRKARATFFVMTPRAVLAPWLIEEMAADGHEVGLHCHRHIRHSKLSEGLLGMEVSTGLRELRSVGISPRSWRAPWGVETDATRRLAARHGLRLCGWSRDTRDWRGDSPERMRASIAAQGGLRDGDVVLMHDGLGPGARRADCATTVELTAMLLDQLERAGLAAATVSAHEGMPV